ncbi:MAG: SagB/ThcOx family dehydrogenase [Bacillota bacterium]
MSLETVLARRRSVREFRDEAIPVEALSQLLWAAYGVVDPSEGRHTVPSAGATFPLEIVAVAGKVTGIPAGSYRYRPASHALEPLRSGDIRAQLARAALAQEFVAAASATLVVAAVPERTTERYGRRGVRYVFMEAGHACQNVYLQAEALGLGTVAVGAFDDEAVRRILGIPEEPLYILPIGRPATGA